MAYNSSSSRKLRVSAAVSHTSILLLSSTYDIVRAASSARVRSAPFTSETAQPAAEKDCGCECFNLQRCLIRYCYTVMMCGRCIVHSEQRAECGQNAAVDDLLMLLKELRPRRMLFHTVSLSRSCTGLVAIAFACWARLNTGKQRKKHRRQTQIFKDLEILGY